MQNQIIYSQKQIVDSYSKSKFLFKAEEVIFNKYETLIKNGLVIDIGVGGGRTSYFLIPKTSHYIGIDYSQTMVEACKQKFNTTDYRVHDAANLETIQNNSADFVLFSFNGIDCVDFNHRTRILKEINRILKPNGIFTFSFHNSQCINKLYTFSLPKNPLNWYKEFKRIKQLKSLNGDFNKFNNLNYFSIYDGAENFETLVLYTKPTFQIAELEKNGFMVENIYNTTAGKCLEINELQNCTIPWIYLTCKKVYFEGQ